MLDIARRLEAAGHDTWCVGGAIRDALLGHPHLDWDLATAATPDQVRELFGGRRTIPIGIEFGTVGVLDRDGRLHEVTTFRRDVTTDGRHATVEFGASIDEDLARRDLTINAIAYHPATGDLRDPFGGQRDLAARIVRAVGDPDERMREDRLRALRALRFAGRLGFTLERSTWAAIVASAPHLGRLSAERVKQEIEKTLEQVAEPAAAFELWRESGALAMLVPVVAEAAADLLAPLDRLRPPSPGAKPYRRILRLAGFFGVAGPIEAAATMVRLRFSKADVAAVRTIVTRANQLGEPIESALAAGRPSDEQVRRWTATAGRLDLPLVMRLLEARWASARAAGAGAAGRSAPSDAAVRALYRRMLRSAARDPLEVADLAIDGDDLRRGGIAAGPALGKILDALLERVIADPAVNVSGTLLAIAQELHEALPGREPGGARRTSSHGN